MRHAPAIAHARRAMPGHPRLAYFATRLEVEEQRTMISQALQAAGTGALNKAAGLIDEAAQVRLGESGAVTEARAELRASRRAAGQDRQAARPRTDADDRRSSRRTRRGQRALLTWKRRATPVRIPRRPSPSRARSRAALIAEASAATHGGDFPLAKEWLARASEADPGAEGLASARSSWPRRAIAPSSSRAGTRSRSSASTAAISSRRAKTVPPIISANCARMHPTTRGSMTRSRASRMLRSAPRAAQWPRISSTTRDTTSTRVKALGVQSPELAAVEAQYAAAQRT